MTKICGIFYLKNGEVIEHTDELDIDTYNQLKQEIRKSFKEEEENYLAFGDFIFRTSELAAVKLSSYDIENKKKYTTGFVKEI